MAGHVQATIESTLAIDANGNTTSSAGITNNYDFENRMTQHGTGLFLTYDGDGNRVSETIGGSTTKFLVDDQNPTKLPQVMDETVSGSVTRTYAYGLNRISENQLVGSTWTPSFYGYDGHENVRFLANSTGTVTDSYDYDAFGMPIRTSGTTPNQFLYSGERYDSSIGLYDLRARYYNQATGRFWARDLKESSRCRPLTFNPYIYVGDEPVDRVDPTGRGYAETIPDYKWRLLFVLTTSVFVKQEVCAAGVIATGVWGIAANAGSVDVPNIQVNWATCSTYVPRKPGECHLIGLDPRHVWRHCIYECEGLGELCKESPCTVTAPVWEMGPCEPEDEE